MISRSAVTLTALLVAGGLAATGMIVGGDYGTPPTPAAAVNNVLKCGRVVDSTGYRQGPLTASLAIALLTGVQVPDGAPGLPAVAPSSTATATLDTMAVTLMGYSGSRLARDAQSFAENELNYNPSGPLDASYAGPLATDIIALQRDCPGGARLGLRWRRGG